MIDLEAQLSQLDWSDFESVSLQCQDVLRALAKEQGHLSDLVQNCIFDKCEKYDLLKKIVLYEGANDTRIRLHLFSGGFYDRPHNHRWPYSALVLRGGYIHRIFTCAQPDPLTAEAADIEPLLIEKRTSGHPYSLGTQVFHSVTVWEPSISLVIRGPAQSDRFRLIDRQTGQSWIQRGAAKETEAERNAKRMTADELAVCIQNLKDEGVING